MATAGGHSNTTLDPLSSGLDNRIVYNQTTSLIRLDDDSDDDRRLIDRNAFAFFCFVRQVYIGIVRMQ